jgi:transposase
MHGSGGKTRLGRITKAGDHYLRSLLVMGARSLLSLAHDKGDRLSRWAMALQERVGYGKAVVSSSRSHEHGHAFRPAGRRPDPA